MPASNNEAYIGVHPLNSPKIMRMNQGTGLRYVWLLKFPRADVNDKRSRVFH